MLPRRVDRLAVDLLIGAAHHEIPIAIEHHHRLRPAIEGIDAILPIDGEAGNARLRLLLPAALPAASGTGGPAPPPLFFPPPGGGGGFFTPKNTPRRGVGAFGGGADTRRRLGCA